MQQGLRKVKGRKFKSSNTLCRCNESAPGCPLGCPLPVIEKVACSRNNRHLYEKQTKALRSLYFKLRLTINGTQWPANNSISSRETDYARQDATCRLRNAKIETAQAIGLYLHRLRRQPVCQHQSFYNHDWSHL